jgi:hypothetical protein
MPRIKSLDNKGYNDDITIPITDMQRINNQFCYATKQSGVFQDQHTLRCKKVGI